MGYSHENHRRRICGSAALPGVVRQLQARGYPAQNIWGLLQHLTLQEVPPLAQQGYSSLCQALGLPPPVLYFARTAFNTFAFYIDGNIVVGVDEIAVLAADVWHQADAPLRNAIAYGYRQNWGRVPNEWQLFEYFKYLVLLLVMAHELGHAAHALGQPSRFQHEEAGADYVSGGAAYRLGIPKGLGELLFYDLGCNTDGCTHPPSGQRRTAFENGFDEAWAHDEAVRQEYARQAARSNDGAALAMLGVLGLFLVGAAAASRR